MLPFDKIFYGEPVPPLSDEQNSIKHKFHGHEVLTNEEMSVLLPCLNSIELLIVQLYYPKQVVAKFESYCKAFAQLDWIIIAIRYHGFIEELSATDLGHIGKRVGWERLVLITTVSLENVKEIHQHVDWSYVSAGYLSQPQLVNYAEYLDWEVVCRYNSWFRSRDRMNNLFSQLSEDAKAVIFEHVNWQFLIFKGVIVAENMLSWGHDPAIGSVAAIKTVVDELF